MTRRTSLLRRQPGRQAGFTLIELLVAVTLASLAAVLGAAVLKAGVDYVGRARHYLSEQEDFHAATKTVRYIWQGRASDAFLGLADQVEFSSRRLDAPANLLATRVRLMCLPTENEGFVLHREFLADTKALEKARAAIEEARKGDKDKKPATPPATPPAGQQPPPAAPAAGTTPPAKIEWLKVAEDDLMTGLAACSFSYLQTIDSKDGKEAKLAIWQPAWLDLAPPRMLRLNLGLRRGNLPPLIFIAG